MQFSSRSSLRDDYVKPLRNRGLIELTKPDKPRVPNQKYVISENGKMFLGGFEIDRTTQIICYRQHEQRNTPIIKQRRRYQNRCPPGR